ncbi:MULTISPECIES: hypothetical protein [unclassified Streptomyces]|uniref:hypothetical protein n=1 Tax=unclassified Streptomyces TaxID=2593676 RepID=UPI0004C239AD|nr:MULTISPECIES: hypothetical protein [unclassified Streptomyces]
MDVVYAVDEAPRIIAAYGPPARPHVDVPPRQGTVTDACLVPPTAQNQGAIEDDLVRTVETALTSPT